MQRAKTPLILAVVSIAFVVVAAALVWRTLGREGRPASGVEAALEIDGEERSAPIPLRSAPPPSSEGAPRAAVEAVVEAATSPELVAASRANQDSRPARSTSHAVDVDPRGVRIRARVVDVGGNPLPGVHLDTFLGTGPWDRRAADPTTDASGRFEWHLPTETLRERATLEIRVHVRGERSIGFSAVAPEGVGERDLGDVVVEPDTLVVMGRVVDRTGEGVPRAALAVMLRRAEEVTPEIPFRERELRLFDANTADDGSFEARWHAPTVLAGHGTLILRVAASDFVDVEFPFLFGQDVGTLVLARLGGVSGRLVLDAGWEREPLRVFAWLDGNVLSYLDAEGRQPKDAALTPDGRFRLRGLAPGVHRLALSGPRWGGPALELWSAVEVTVDDEAIELGTLDLHGRLAVTSVTVRDAEGQRVDEVRSSHATPDGGMQAGFRTRRAESDGSFRFAHRHPEAEAFLTIDYPHMEERVLLRGASLDVTMRRASQHRVRLIGVERLDRYAKPPHSIALYTAHARNAAPVVTLDDDGSFAFTAFASGSYELMHLGDRGRVIGSFVVDRDARTTEIVVAVPEDY